MEKIPHKHFNEQDAKRLVDIITNNNSNKYCMLINNKVLTDTDNYLGNSILSGRSERELWERASRVLRWKVQHAAAKIHNIPDTWQAFRQAKINKDVKYAFKDLKEYIINNYDIKIVPISSLEITTSNEALDISSRNSRDTF